MRGVRYLTRSSTVAESLLWYELGISCGLIADMPRSRTPIRYLVLGTS